MANPFLSCVHTHTHFCDGKDAPERLVEKALELGFVSLGFSGHSPVGWDPWAMTEKNLPQYMAEIRRLQKKYDGQLEILLGIEHDSLAGPVSADFEYSIESVHAIVMQGEICYIDWDTEKVQAAIQTYFGGDPYAYAKAYFAACAAAYEKSSAQIVGHLDLLTKFNERSPMLDETDPRYLRGALEALDAALARGMIPEVNTGAISRGYRTTPYPGTAILKHLLERKAAVVVTSDCHDANYLNCHYKETAELLRSLGFTCTLRLRKAGWEEVGL